MPKSKSLGERFLQQEGGGGGGSKIYSSGTDPYQEGGSRKPKEINWDYYADLALPTIGEKRKKSSPMVGTRDEHLARIRPDPEDNRRTAHRRNTNLGETLVQTKNWRHTVKNKTTRYHTHATGWYLHGPNAGEPRPGRKAAMIKAYTIAALNDFKHPGRQRSKYFIDLFKEIREDLFGPVYNPKKKKGKN